jgi:hypothetical protein
MLVNASTTKGAIATHQRALANINIETVNLRQFTTHVRNLTLIEVNVKLTLLSFHDDDDAVSWIIESIIIIIIIIIIMASIRTIAFSS